MTEGYRQRGFIPPPDATEILLVRHGASAPAFPGRLFPKNAEGRGDPALAPEGVEQAEAVARRLAADPPAALFVTRLRRTAETAAPLATRLAVEPVVVPELDEVHLGEWEAGEYRVRLVEGDPRAWRTLEEERWDVIPGAESMESLASRVRAGIEAIVATTGPGARAAAFLHGGVIGEACRQAAGSRPFAFVHGDNGSISRLVVFADGRWLLRSFNEPAQLAAPPPADVRVGTSALVTRDGRLLLGLRTGAHGAATWAPPGGKPDAGEPPEAAAARELEEETGLVATRVRPVAWTSDVFISEGLHYVTLHHEVEVQPGEPRILEPAKCEAWEWFARDELPSPLFAPIASLLADGWRF